MSGLFVLILIARKDDLVVLRLILLLNLLLSDRSDQIAAEFDLGCHDLNLLALMSLGWICLGYFLMKVKNIYWM